MSEHDNLLTRRQLIGLLGGTGAAIGMASGLEGVGSGEGNLNAGRMALTEDFKAADDLFWGPLSVRADVPQRDGVTFIQTDAGAANDKYKFFTYDSGWQAKGLDTPAITTEEINRTHFYSQYASLQAAIDAVDESTYTDGRVFIDQVAPSSSDFISETVSLVGWMEIRGFGINTYVKGSGDHTFTIPSGETDGQISHIWVDNGDADTHDAIHGDGKEWTIGPQVDIDNAGRYGVNVNASRWEILGTRWLGPMEADAYLNLTNNADRFTAANITMDSDGTKTSDGIVVANEAVNAKIGARIDNIGGDGVRTAGDGGVYVLAIDNVGGKGVHLQSGAQWNRIYGGAMRSGGDDLVIDGDDNHIWGRFDNVAVNTGAQDNRFWGRAVVSFTDNGTRTLINGWGVNAGDPNSAGDWNGNGEEGICVWDSTNGLAYVYRNGGWQRLDGVTGTNDTDDSMTADPETASESGYLEVNVSGSTKQVPFYDP